MAALPFQRHYRALRKRLPASKPTILVTSCLAWVFCVLSLARCTFLSQPSHLTDDSLDMGLFSRAIYDKDGDILGCVAYTDTSFLDTNFKIGRAFGITAALCSSIVMLFVTISILFCPKGCDILWNASKFYLAAATVGQMFSFFALNSEHCRAEDQSCTLSGVGKLGLFNIFVLASLTVKLFWESPPTHPWLHFWSDGHEEETVATDPSGSLRKVKKNKAGVVDPFSAEASSDDDDGNHGGRSPQHMLQMEVHHEEDHDGTASIASGATGHSMQDTVEGAVSLQSLKSFRLLTMFLLATSWAISVVGVNRCTLFLVGPEGGERSDFSGLGLFSRAAYHKGRIIGCLAYPDEATEHFDSNFQMSRVFGSIAAFLMSAVFALACLQLFIRVARDEIWLVIRVLLPCATASQMLVFLGYKTETCSVTDLVECMQGPT